MTKPSPGLTWHAWLFRMALALAIVPASATARAAQLQTRQQEPWAPYHLTSLPPEIKASVMRYQGACGDVLSATHLFARPRNLTETRFIALHFESLWCPNAKAVCRPEGCLHEVYASTGGVYRRVYQGHVQEITLSVSGDRVELVRTDTGAQRLRWNGSGFVPARVP